MLMMLIAAAMLIRRIRLLMPLLPPDALMPDVDFH